MVTMTQAGVNPRCMELVNLGLRQTEAAMTYITKGERVRLLTQTFETLYLSRLYCRTDKERDLIDRALRAIASHIENIEKYPEGQYLPSAIY